jgi:hypothetical protein
MMFAFDLAMPKKRGNPNWGKPAQSVPATSTEFEWKLKELGLTKETCVSSVRLRTWCAANKNRRYIPEWLLKAYGMRVDPDVSVQLKNPLRRPLIPHEPRMRARLCDFRWSKAPVDKGFFHIQAPSDP